MVINTGKSKNLMPTSAATLRKKLKTPNRLLYALIPPYAIFQTQRSKRLIKHGDWNPLSEHPVGEYP